MDWKYRRRGGQEGWAPTPGQYESASRRFEKYTGKYIAAIPVPGAPKQPCSSDAHRGGGFEPGSCNWDYWEMADGSHGWCCEKCGMILQWG